MTLGTSGRDSDTCMGKYAKSLEVEPPSLKCVCVRGGAPCLSPSSVGDHNQPSLSPLLIPWPEEGEPDARQREVKLVFYGTFLQLPANLVG